MKRVYPYILTLLIISSLANAQAFKEETINIKVTEGQLGGVLMFPNTKKKPPVVLIIQGSGPTDKDGNSAVIQGDNNSLKMLAKAFAEAGIASLRFDKRGQGLSKSAGKAEKDLSFDDFVNDAKSWLNYLVKNKKFKKVGVAGHSQGSLIGMLISQNENVHAFASIAGPSLGIGETILTQVKSNPNNPPAVIENTERIISELTKGNQVDDVPAYLNSLFRPSIQPFIGSWMKYKPQDEIGKLNIPVSIFNGTNDLQVTIEDANRLKAVSPIAQLVVVDGMNHVLKNSPKDQQGNIATYGNPELPLNALFKSTIVSFFQENLKKK